MGAGTVCLYIHTTFEFFLLIVYFLLRVVVLVCTSFDQNKMRGRSGRGDEQKILSVLKCYRRNITYIQDELSVSCV